MFLQKPVARLLKVAKKQSYVQIVPAESTDTITPVLSGTTECGFPKREDNVLGHGGVKDDARVAAAQVGLQDFMAIKKLGFGDSGVVYLTKHAPTGKLYAIKKMEKEFLDSNAIEMLLQEQRALLTVRGRAGLLRVEASFHDSESFYHVTPFMAGRDLRGQMTRCGRLQPYHALFYAANLVLALETLHGLGLIHCDLKPENVLIDADGYPVLGDFGMSQHRAPASAQPYVPCCGVYCAPEVLDGRPFSVEADLWALGVTLFEMLCARKPFRVAFDELRESVLRDPVLFELGDTVDIHAQLFIFHILQKDPKDRLSPRAVKEHRFFGEIDWERLARRGVGAPWTPNVAALAAEVKAAERDNLCFALPGADPLRLDPFPDYTFEAPSAFAAVSPSDELPHADPDTRSAVVDICTSSVTPTPSDTDFDTTFTAPAPLSGLALLGIPDFCNLSELHRTISMPYAAAAVSSPSLGTYPDSATPSIASPTNTSWSASTSSTALYTPSPRADSPSPAPSRGTTLGALTDLRRWMKRLHT